jgi:hypothetical protein
MREVFCDLYALFQERADSDPPSWAPRGSGQPARPAKRNPGESFKGNFTATGRNQSSATKKEI